MALDLVFCHWSPVHTILYHDINQITISVKLKGSFLFPGEDQAPFHWNIIYILSEGDHDRQNIMELYFKQITKEMHSEKNHTQLLFTFAPRQ